MRLAVIIIVSLLWTWNNGEIIEIIEEGSGDEVELRTNENSFNNDTRAPLHPGVAALLDAKPENIPRGSSTAGPIEECLPKLDLVFLLDSSGSIEQIYQEHVRWALALVDSLPIEPDAVHVAAVQYAGFPLTEFALGTYPKVEDVRQHLQQINFQSGITRTGYALRKAESELFLEDRGARADALKVIILFTDGLSIDDPLKPAAQLRDHKGVKIYVVSVGDDGFKSEMSRIAGDCENVFGPQDLPRLRTALLNDAERARACSQIGPSWLKRQQATTTPQPGHVLNKALLPPLDFLGLLNEDDSAETKSKEKELKKASSISLKQDNLTLVAEERHTTTTLKTTTTVASTTAPAVTKVEIPVTETKAVTVAETTVTSTKATTTTPEVATTTKTNEKPEIIVKKPESANSKAFAAQLNEVSESEDIIDVFDIPVEERKKLPSTTVPPTTRRRFTRKSTTSAPATTELPKTTTTKKIKTTRARKILTSTTEAPTTIATTKRRSTTAPATIRIVPQTIIPHTIEFRRTTARPRPRSFTQKVSFSASSSYCPMDLLFLVDSSGSVQKNYDVQKQYIKEILNEAQLGERTHRVSLLQFAGSNIQKTEWSFDAFSSNSDLMKALNQVRLITGTTYIGAALDTGLQLLENRRPNVPIIVVLVSDGFSQDDATSPAERIRMIPNVQFYSLSVSELTNINYLNEIVGDPKHVYASSKASDLKDLLIKKLRCR